ncbi:MAG TPA: DUF2283 domain-containing protein [Capsulimonadaceae bacterium]
MKLEIDEDANAVYLYLSDAAVAKSKIIEPGVNYDFDANGQLRGIEVVHARSVFGELSDLTAEKMLAMFIVAHTRPAALAA